jgi:hypothetical protein
VFDWGTGKWVKGTTDVKTAEDQLKESLRAVQNTTESINLESALLILNKQKEIDTNQKWSSELTTAMATAKTEMDSYQAQIEAISTRIAGMERNVAVQIALDDKATAGLTQIKALLDDISIPRTASVNLSTGRSLASEGATLNQYLPAIEADKAKKKAEEEKTPYIPPEPSPTIPDFNPFDPGASFARGLNYVPRDNFRASLHEGEAVLTKQQATQWRGGGGQVIHFTLSPTINGAGKDPAQLAKELVRPLKDEMRRLAGLGAG